MPKIDCDKSFLQSIDSRFQIPELERADEPNGNWGGGEANMIRAGLRAAILVNTKKKKLTFRARGPSSKRISLFG